MIVHGITDNDVHPPVFGASQRLFGLYRGIARAHTVRVLSIVPNRSRGVERETVAGIELRRTRAWYTSVAWRLERARLAPLFLAADVHGARARALLDLLPAAFDVLMADIGVAPILERVHGPLRVYHAHNVEYDHFRSAGPRLYRRERWAERLRALEGRVVAAADLVVAASDEDAARFRSLYGAPPERVLAIRNGYDDTALRPPTAAERARARVDLGVGDDERVALFMGSDVPHNRAGLEVLLRAFERLADPRMKLLVLGRVSQALGSRREPWLIARPETPDPLPFLHASDVGLNPVVGGGGSNVKLPSYLAAGLAVVSTPHGARGYDDLARWVTVAEAEAIADALRARPTGWHAAGAAAPPPLARYAWGTLGERLGECLAARLAGSATAVAEGAGR